MVFTTEGLFEVAIESWPEWNLIFIYVNMYMALNINKYDIFIYVNIHMALIIQETYTWC